MEPNHKPLRFLFSWGPVILFAAVIFWFSSRTEVPELPGTTDKFVHFAEYFLFALLLWRALAGELFWRFDLRRSLAVFLTASVYAFSDEVHQSFVPGRNASFYDWLADVAGILGMITLVLSGVKWRGRDVNHHYEKI